MVQKPYIQIKFVYFFFKNVTSKIHEQMLNMKIKNMNYINFLYSFSEITFKFSAKITFSKILVFMK